MVCGYNVCYNRGWQWSLLQQRSLEHLGDICVELMIICRAWQEGVWPFTEVTRAYNRRLLGCTGKRHIIAWYLIYARLLRLVPSSPVTLVALSQPPFSKPQRYPQRVHLKHIDANSEWRKRNFWRLRLAIFFPRPITNYYNRLLPPVLAAVICRWKVIQVLINLFIVPQWSQTTRPIV